MDKIILKEKLEKWDQNQLGLLMKVQIKKMFIIESNTKFVKNQMIL